MALNISSDLVPQVINDYNAYTEDDLLIGLADEITLPKIKNKTTSVSGMGIAGEVDSPVPGQFESMEATLNWNTMYSYATKMMNPNKNIQITLRAAMQSTAFRWPASERSSPQRAWARSGRHWMVLVSVSGQH